VSEPRADAFVFFGATGDLAKKQIYPALAGLTAAGQLDMPVIGVARRLQHGDELKELARASLKAHGHYDAGVFERLASRLIFVAGDYEDDGTFDRLDQALGAHRHPLYYLAIPPSLFATVSTALGRVGRAAGARVIVEKPFGRSLASARQLNVELHKSFPESAVFRIDHYLGKEPVQNLLYFRFANAFMEPVWNAAHVRQITITMSEAFDVSGRGAFYEEVGAIRDVVQNHLLQLVSLTAMEPPADDSLESLHAARTAALEAVEPLTANDVVLGQYAGYREERGVKPDSTVETYAAVRLSIATPRWSGVPFVIRTGKALDETLTEVVAEFRNPDTNVFRGTDPAPPNRLTFRVGPDVYTAIDARAKVPGEEMRGELTRLIARASDGHEGHTHGPDIPPYQRLIGDALDGDQTLFTTERGIEACWRIVDPVVNAGIPVSSYTRGSRGPVDPF
jgi:glucose-6-phosphate 1-dehydrogenase